MPQATEYARSRCYTPAVQPFVINNAGGPAVNLGGTTFLGVLLPASLDITGFEIEGSIDGTTFYPAYDDDNNKLTFDYNATGGFFSPKMLSLTKMFEYVRFKPAGSTAVANYVVTFISGPL